MIQLFNDPNFAAVGMLGLGMAGFALIKVYTKIISKLH